MEANGHYDVIIAGGGLVGASLCSALAGSPLRLAVVEPVARRAPGQPSFDERMTALAPTTRRIFEALGLWSQIRPDAAPIRQIHVSDRGRPGFVRMSAAEEGVDALGHVVPNRRLGTVLPAAVAAQDNVTEYCPAEVTGVETDAEGVSVHISDEAGQRSLRGRLLVGADGARSAVREILGLEARWRGYGQCAVIANLVPEHDHRGVAYERFTPDGPLAVLPATDGRCALVWTLPESRVEDALSLNDDAFLAALQERFGHRLGRLLKVSERHAYPLGWMRASRVTAERSVLIGNAAHTLHPVAGQGFNLAMRDVAVLAEQLHGAALAGGDIGDARVLEAYADLRRQDYRLVMGFTHGLVTLFSNDLPLLAPMRNAGLVAMDLLPGVKRRFMRTAMGRAGWLPRLARGLPLEGTA
ncbi:2-octaprenyl-6-methoxyphenyl hydroxylase [Ectothiorhodospiraceae bacterium WFHF3C12]|nr:2-octaprenyl-6-methoxyphenyl hydroxylase [Ectothiorhodospiraceae bacterium WFHF3C12]